MAYYEQISQEKGDLPFEKQVEMLQHGIKNDLAANTINAQEAIFDVLKGAMADRVPDVIFNDHIEAPTSVPYVTASWRIEGDLNETTGLVPFTSISANGVANASMLSRQVWDIRRVLGYGERSKVPDILGVEGKRRGLLRRYEFDEAELSLQAGKKILESPQDVVLSAHVEFAEPQHATGDHITKAKHMEGVGAVVGRPGRPDPNSPLLWSAGRLITETAALLDANGRGEDRSVQLYDVENYLMREISVVPTRFGSASREYANLGYILGFIPAASSER